MKIYRNLGYEILQKNKNKIQPLSYENYDKLDLCYVFFH